MEQASLLLHIFAADIHNTIAVYHISLFIYSDATVCISVIGKTYIAAFIYHKFL